MTKDRNRAQNPDPTIIEGTVVTDEDLRQEWNPLEVGKVERIPLDVSGGRAAILCRRWSGRERLAYEDAITERLLQTEQRTGEDTIKIGSLRLFAASLTIIGSEGFDPFVGRPGFLQGERPEREADLLQIGDPETYDEILRHAMRVQPLPSAGGGDDEKSGGTDQDPSRTLSTPGTSNGVAGA
jgi:hypothetical protein